ncbi:DUF2141 domain-containing protein [Pacificimonas sp. WHA3]|uniref:DUF2141 domain-containing protein n=1 Tax=Pacificimonas pallii TaxID=2827236 RepID=A0ABS6SCS4_9SPHN|nr:DUF2141 domain-containing protein [Pacificimonas pallii]MBV7255647.1 DUF2141 domain-containing protein [Pacificimonas pallii]
MIPRAFIKIAAVSLACASAITLPSGAADLTVNIDGVRDAPGKLYVSLQTQSQFMKDEGAYGVMIDSPAAGVSSPTVTGIAPGTYAITVWHDDNDNGEFDMGERGPLDGWAMIGGTSMRAEPTFAQTSLTIGEADESVSVVMIYGRETP